MGEPNRKDRRMHTERAGILHRPRPRADLGGLPYRDDGAAGEQAAHSSDDPSMSSATGEDLQDHMARNGSVQRLATAQDLPRRNARAGRGGASGES